MKIAGKLQNEYDVLKAKVAGELSIAISRSCGKNVLDEDDLECGQHGDYLTFIDSFSGDSKYFHLVGISSDGDILAINEDGTPIEGMKLDQMELWAQIEVIEMLENL